MNYNFILLLIAGSFLTSLVPVSSIRPGSEKAPGRLAHKPLCIGFYNVENLFDTLDDPISDDQEFTPNGKSHWTRDKYAKKISNLAKVIRAMNDGKGPDILGLSEVENKHVLVDLLSDPQLKKIDYGIVHHDSPDMRGIDVAMIYKKNVFTVLQQKAFPVDISQYDDHPTRDILMVTGISRNDTFMIFLNHWPSRRGGREASEPRRIAAATVLKKATDSILSFNPGAKIIAMGDFNDNPTDKSLAQVLKVSDSPGPAGKNSLYNCDVNFDWKKGEGSEFYRGDWSRFIQIIVTSSLIMNQTGPGGTFTDIHLFRPDWLLVSDTTYKQMIPKRMFQENNTIGFSDHLPVYIELKN